jgi:hypothetical protein
MSVESPPTIDLTPFSFQIWLDPGVLIYSFCSIAIDLEIE